jgi:PTH2 family peptidyl-tRNA hydrolase
MTELPPGTLTVIGIGPAKIEAIDEVTKELKLL